MTQAKIMLNTKNTVLIMNGLYQSYGHCLELANRNLSHLMATKRQFFYNLPYFLLKLVSFLEYCPPLNSSPFFLQIQYIKMGTYSNFCTFEITSLVNVPRY